MKKDTHSFIVRVWTEDSDNNGAPVTWRGSIDHVGQGERMYFYDLEGIVRFIRDQIGIRTKHSATIWQSAIARIRHVFRG